jgi:hypothetical protein
VGAVKLNTWKFISELLINNLAVGVIVIETIGLVYLFRMYGKAKDDCTKAYQQVIPAVDELKKTIDLIIQLSKQNP